MLWYHDRKRSHHALETYPVMDACYYPHLQPPSLKYMKPEPVAYYHYAEDPERYQANITVSVQSAFGSAGTSALAGGYNPAPQYSYTSTAFGTSMTQPTDSSSVYGTLGVSGGYQTTPVSASAMARTVSPIRSSGTTADEATSMGTPLTPPLSVSPVPATGSPTPPHSIVSNAGATTNSYLEKENTISYRTGSGYRSGSVSPSRTAQDCDSTTHCNQGDLLADTEVIPKLPLHVLSDLSEGLPLPGM